VLAERLVDRMDQKDSHELTTTLHLGQRESAESSPAALIESLLSASNADEQEVISAVMGGPADSAMVFIHRGPSRGARFLITSSGVSIGRSASNEVALDDVTVSRSHATIKYEDQNFRFTDLGSLNGSYINNKQTSSHTLKTGDEIQVGKFHLLFIGAQQGSGK
jgi:hypothetical protein